MAGDFQVRPGELSELVSGFQGLIGEVHSAAGQVSAGSAGAAGDPGLEGALGSFLARWSGGINRLHESLSELSDHVASAAAAYSATDSDVSSAFSG